MCLNRKFFAMLVLTMLLGMVSGCDDILGPFSSETVAADGAVVSMGVDRDDQHFVSRPSHHATVQRSSASLASALKSPANQVYYFNFNNSHVERQYIASIDAQANYLINHSSARIRLEGHTDALGSREYNIALGWRRAKSVARLMKQLGVSPKQLFLVSYGEEKLINLGADEKAISRNRRVRLIYESR